MKTAEIILELQPTIAHPPLTLKQMYDSACSSDGPTMDHWSKIWISNMEENKKRFGSFADKSIGKLFNIFEGKPCIIAGAGPSLRFNVDKLKDRPKCVSLISCLHSFHLMEDAGAKPDFYVSLDAGPVTIEEVTEGSNKDPESYWELTKDRVLLAYCGSHPDLLKKWKGEIYFFNAPIPSREIREASEKIEPFNQWVSNGGSVLGACLYIAKGFFGSQTTIFIGSDFCFSNREKMRFHAWDSKYDASIGNVVKAVDIYGNAVNTWPSYWNFKLWFDFVSMSLPGIYINATEGGILGAYREGNIGSILQVDLSKVIEMYSMSEKLRYQAEHPDVYAKESDIILI